LSKKIRRRRKAAIGKAKNVRATINIMTATAEELKTFFGVVPMSMEHMELVLNGGRTEEQVIADKELKKGKTFMTSAMVDWFKRTDHAMYVKLLEAKRLGSLVIKEPYEYTEGAGHANSNQRLLHPPSEG
jgi:hypothetical protein